MTRQDKIAALDRLARLKREMALAELARLASRKRDLAREREALHQQAAAAMRTGAGAPGLALVAERFARWSRMRDTVLADEARRLDRATAEQKDHAARAVGRQHVLERIMDKIQKKPPRPQG